MGKEERRRQSLTAQLHQNLTKTGAAFLIKSPAFDNHNVCWITIEAERVVLRAKKDKDVTGSMTFAELLDKLGFDLEAWENSEKEKERE